MVFSTTNLRRAVSTSVIATTFVFAPFLGAIAQAVTLNGAGATFPAPLYEQYARQVTQKYPDLKVNYQGIGSGGGVKQMIAGTVDFGGSDFAMSDEEIAQVKNGVLLIPTAGGAVSVVFNLPGVNNLRFSREVLSSIFSGRITRWSDPRIGLDNPGVKLPTLPIKTVVRADGSGTTYIFTNHLSAISSYFKGRIGVSKDPKWLTNSLKGKGNPGVAALVGRTSGAIGYVEYAYAKSNRLTSATIQNKRGEYVAPSLETANQALATVKFPANFRTFIDDPTAGYPIAGLTWIMVYKQYPDAAKAQAVRNWIQWILTDGQKLNAGLDYTSIPADVAARALQSAQTIKP